MRTDDLYRHLATTGERPVERTPSRWLGEAEAVAEDMRHIENRNVLADRAAEVVHLLSQFDATGDPEADEHVEKARELARELAQGE
jgi:hypothetical protein